MSKILIGADPEFFLRERASGKLISAVGLIGGSKYEPRPISDKGHTIQEDNVAVEIGFTPSESWRELSSKIDYCLDYVKSIIPTELEIYLGASGNFELDQLNTEGARTMGCDPDFNAWTNSRNPLGNPSESLRTCGGHIHIGYSQSYDDMSVLIIQAMDLFLGVPSIILDQDTERRKMYGKAGAFRFKSYGVEYRTISNFWIQSSDLIRWAYNNSIKAVEFAKSSETIDNKTRDRIIECINTSNKELAYELVEQFNLDILETVLKEKI